MFLFPDGYFQCLVTKNLYPMLAKFPYKTFVFYTSVVPNFVYVQYDVMAVKKKSKNNLSTFSIAMYHKSLNSFYGL